MDEEPLAEILGDQELGVWALGPRVITELSRRFRVIRPQRVLEFGSGASTLCLAYLAREMDGSRSQTVIALDQDASFAEATRGWLDRAGLGAYATVIHAPLVQSEVGGRTYSCYSLPENFDDLIGEIPVQLVLVDGPYAERGARYATLPIVRAWLADGATVLLDDALRDGELEVARLWQDDGFVMTKGIALIEKGLLVGETRPGPATLITPGAHHK